MWKQIPLLLLLLLVLVFGVGACSRALTAPVIGEATQIVGQASALIVPDSLSTIEADAEDIMDFAPQSDWARIQKDTTHIREAWQLYLPQAEKDGAPQTIQKALTAALDQLQTALQTQDSVATQQAANDLSAAVVELFALYNTAIPADIGRLDVLGRQIILDANAGDWAKAEETLTQTNDVWRRVKPVVLAHKGDAAASQYDANLSAQMAWLNARDLKNLITEANNGLEIVDALERVFP